MENIVLPSFNNLVAATILMLLLTGAPIWLFLWFVRQPLKFHHVSMTISAFALTSALCTWILAFAYPKNAMLPFTAIMGNGMIDYVVPFGFILTLMMPLWWFFLLVGISAKFNINLLYITPLAFVSTLVSAFAGYFLAFALAIGYSGTII